MPIVPALGRLRQETQWSQEVEDSQLDGQIEPGSEYKSKADLHLGMQQRQGVGLVVSVPSMGRQRALGNSAFCTQIYLIPRQSLSYFYWSLSCENKEGGIAGLSGSE